MLKNNCLFYSLTLFLLSFSITLPQEPLEFIKEGNLIWQKCNIGENPIDCTGEPKKMKWKEAIEACNNLSLSNKKWRLPNLDELRTLIQFKDLKKPNYRDSCGAENFNLIAGNKRKFPTLQPFFYWSSTEKKDDTFFALFVDFTNGLSNYNPTSIRMYVKCITY